MGGEGPWKGKEKGKAERKWQGAAMERGSCPLGAFLRISVMLSLVCFQLDFCVLLVFKDLWGFFS